MEEPILKVHWERYRAHVDLELSTVRQLISPFTSDDIENFTLLSEGCVNTNYKVTFKNARSPVVLRIYVKESEVLKREIEVYQLVQDKVPVPGILYSDDRKNLIDYPYALFEWIDGKLFRELILIDDEQAISECAFDAGVYLDELRNIKFSQGGFFEEGLAIRPFNHDENYLAFALMRLNTPEVEDSLGKLLHSALVELLNEHSHLFPSEKDANLTHGDYDPANMLVKKVGDEWKIVAILDWEFTMAGHYMLDMGMMLRYSHKISACYEQAFISGMTHSGNKLPLDWKKSIKLMDLSCLLNLCYYNPKGVRPNLNRDVVSLIEHTVQNWSSF